MWANVEVARLLLWMRNRNSSLSKSEKLHFLGLDVYSLFESIEAILGFLKNRDPELARQVQQLYACFDPFDKSEVQYARSLRRGFDDCEDQVVSSLLDLRKLRQKSLAKRELFDAFDAEQNAVVVKNAEHYYRSMILADEESWNIRDRHMLETLKRLFDFFGTESKLIVWAHNTHIGDYRATSMAQKGLVNLGGLAREHWGPDSVQLVGFSSYRGDVIASSHWEGPIQNIEVPPAREGSLEALMNRVARDYLGSDFYCIFEETDRRGVLARPKDHRAIGVVYDPRYESVGNYVPSSLSQRYDAFVFVDESRALSPLQVQTDYSRVPETWPSAQ